MAWDKICPIPIGHRDLPKKKKGHRQKRKLNLTMKKKKTHPFCTVPVVFQSFPHTPISLSLIYKHYINWGRLGGLCFSTRWLSRNFVLYILSAKQLLCYICLYLQLEHVFSSSLRQNPPQFSRQIQTPIFFSSPRKEVGLLVGFNFGSSSTMWETHNEQVAVLCNLHSLIPCNNNLS